MNNNRISAMEILWVSIAFLTLVAGIHRTFLLGFSVSYPFYIFSFIAIIMYYLRKYMRKNRKPEQ